MRAKTFSMDDSTLRKLVDKAGAEQHRQVLAGSWWHSIDLGDGQVTPGVHSLKVLQDNYRRFHLPENLSRKRVLDIGCWDGFYSFEAERRGAEVVAIDCLRQENFFRARAALDSKVEFHELSVYELNRDRLGGFDIVLFLGVLYHLRHPLLALERVCEMTTDVAIVESHVIDGILPAPGPIMEFYEEDELGGQYDNWWGPNTECLTRMVRSAGFAHGEIVSRDPTRAVVRACRSWPDAGPLESADWEIVDVVNAISMDRTFPNSGRQAFLDISVRRFPREMSRDDVRVSVGGFGVRPSFVGTSADPDRAGIAQINVTVPPGLDVGPTAIRVAIDDRVSAEYQIDLVEGHEW